jgi:tRNA threonylcarbamoyladenosine biosynthesis protein TsaE
VGLGVFCIGGTIDLMEIQTSSLEEFEAEAARFVEGLVPNVNHATVVLLSGNLGAGKTAFVKAVAQTLGVEGVVNSPTFVLEKIYQIPGDERYQRLVHIDAYRLEGQEELAPLAFDEFLKDPRNLIMLEWPEKVGLERLAPATTISIEVLSETERKLTYG